MNNTRERTTALARRLGFGLGFIGFATLVLAERARPWLIPLGVNPPLSEAIGWMALSSAVACLLLAWLLPIGQQTAHPPRSGRPPHTALLEMSKLEPTPTTTTLSPSLFSDASSPAEAVPPPATSTSSATEPDLLSTRTITECHTPKDRWSVQLLRIMDWQLFNALCTSLFTQGGLKASVQTDQPYDVMDLHLYTEPADDTPEPVSIIRCKQWASEGMAHQLLRDLARKKQRGRVMRASLVMLLTPSAELLRNAEDQGIRILDAQGLLKLIEQREPQEQAALLNVATQGEFWRPSCPDCGQKMASRVSRRQGLPYWYCPTKHGDARRILPVRKG